MDGMRAKNKKNAIVEICPVRNVVARFGDKWSFLTLLVLGEQGVLRFSELRRFIPDISSRVLSGTLRKLEADGLIERRAFPVVPPRVEYKLSATGASLVPLVIQLTEWARVHMKTIVQHRAERESP